MRSTVGAVGSTRGAGYGNAIAAPLLFRHPASLDHDTGFGHPERPDRIRAIESALEPRGWLGYETREAPEASIEQLRLVHPAAHVDAVREHCAAGRPFDADTPVSPGSWDAALRGAGGACALADALLTGGAPTGFSLTRPPGHHCESDRAMGFCLFANVAIAARHALAAHGAERVLVLDWDVHHGNGTHAIFHAVPEVLFASIHQWPFYPGTGALSDAGSGAGEGFTINLPAPAGSGEAEFLGLVEHVVVPIARSFAPDLVLISAGFDAHRDDPLAECMLEASSFGELTRSIGTVAAEVGAPIGAVLEGGYDLGALAASVAETMVALSEGGAPGEVVPTPLVGAARERHAEFWDVLG